MSQQKWENEVFLRKLESVSRGQYYFSSLSEQLHFRWMLSTLALSLHSDIPDVGIELLLRSAATETTHLETAMITKASSSEDDALSARKMIEAIAMFRSAHPGIEDRNLTFDELKHPGVDPYEAVRNTMKDLL